MTDYYWYGLLTIPGVLLAVFLVVLIHDIIKAGLRHDYTQDQLELLNVKIVDLIEDQSKQRFNSLRDCADLYRRLEVLENAGKIEAGN